MKLSTLLPSSTSSKLSAIVFVIAVTGSDTSFAQGIEKDAVKAGSATDSAAVNGAAVNGAADAGRDMARGSGGGHGKKMRGSGAGHGKKRGSGSGHGEARGSGAKHGMKHGMKQGMMRGSHAAHGMMKKGQAKRAMMEAHIAYKKSALNITAEQTAQWDAYIALIRQRKALKRDMRKTMKAAKKNGTALERIDLRLTTMTAMLDIVKSLKSETENLYSVLNDEQKKMANVLLW